MIEGNERLIIVMGMAHSGTTILTYVLKHHPEILCCTDGTEAWLLENTWLPLELKEPIQQFLNNYPDKRILLKRPWSEVWHGNWMQQEMPNAKYIYCYRNFGDIYDSWVKPTSMLPKQWRDRSLDGHKQFYDMCLQHASEFAGVVPNYRRHDHALFVNNARRAMNDLTQWLQLPAWNFDISMVSHLHNIKTILRS